MPTAALRPVDESSAYIRDPATNLCDHAEALLAERLWQRIAKRIADSIERDLIPSKLPSSDQQAFAMLKGIAHDLIAASDALEAAAQTLRNITGKGKAAQDAHIAGRRAREAAQGIIDG